MDSATLGSEATLIGGGTVNGNLVITGDLTVQGNFNFGDAGVDIMTIAGYIQGSASGNTSVNIGAGSPATMTPATDALFVTGDTELSGQLYTEGNLRVNNNLVIGDDIIWGGLSTSTRTQIKFSGGFDQWLLAVGSDYGRQIVLGDALYNTRDYDHPVPTNPTLFINSVEDPNVDNTQWMSLEHDQTNGVIAVGSGSVSIPDATLGIIEMPEDGGIVDLVDMSVTATPPSGTEEGYVFNIDGFPILTVKTEADSAGSIETNKVLVNARLLGQQGADVASATNLTLSEGNAFELTGTTKVDLISNLGWTEGSEITLIANENVTIDHGTATATTNITILLAGAGDFAMTANDTLKLLLCSTTAGGQAWRETGRAVI
jgi:hypothetical protein|tara:strand:- start:5568 stop:6689 length:1122 start_codon:yes stop_codon:yes gene_type:complete